MAPCRVLVKTDRKGSGLDNSVSSQHASITSRVMEWREGCINQVLRPSHFHSLIRYELERSDLSISFNLTSFPCDQTSKTLVGW
jgi:hypothetical protein